MKRNILIACLLLLLVPWLAPANPRLMTLQTDDGQWALPSKNYSATRYSKLDKIKAGNVEKLRHAWSFSTGALRGHEGQPLVVGTTMYVHSAFPNHIYALDLTKEKDGPRIKWKYTPKQDEQAVVVACCDLVHRGVNYAEGMILFATLDGQVVALSADSGKEVWKAKAANPRIGETMTMAGLVIKNNYIVGVSGGEFGVRGWVAAYDIHQGSLIWKAYSMGPDEEIKLAPDFNAANPHYGQRGAGIDSWLGDTWKHGGGTTWGWYAYDPELNLLYYSTGNPGSWNPTPRGNKDKDNKWSMTIFARNPDNGQAKWAYQMTPWDAWDYDGVNEHILIDVERYGRPVKALAHFDRNGFAYLLDRTNGTLLAAKNFVEVNWATDIDIQTGRPKEVPEKRTKQGVITQNICPCAMGAKDQQPAAFSPETKFFYVPTNNMCMNFEGTEVQYTAGAPFVGANVVMFARPNQKLGKVIAWNAEKWEEAWVQEEEFPVWSGVLATAGNVVFHGTMDGWFKARDAGNGKVLWEHKLPSGIVGNPITYLGPDGKQYVAIYSGVGGWFGLPLAANLPPDDPTGALGAVGVMYRSHLDERTALGGSLHVFALE